MKADILMELEQLGSDRQSIRELCNFAAAGLVPMLDPDRQIFCDIYNRTETGMCREGLSPRYTMMTLLGLHRYEKSVGRSPIGIEAVLKALLQDTGWVGCAGDLGLLLWTCAELAPERLKEVYSRVRAQSALQRFNDARRGSTMEVAWFLTGVATCYLSGYGDLPGLAEQMAIARQILEQNCGASGIYGHLWRGGSLTSYARGRFGSFADQVYPTIAFARLSRVLQDERARQMASRTAEKMCALQGSLGEWFWQYDSVTGRVVSRYPVYSVHQHAMGPMMLFEVEEATGRDFTQDINKGLAWISGKNELGRDFVEPSLGLVWRCIYLESNAALADACLRFLRLRKRAVDAKRLKIRYECRPYELGWLLYAFAGK